MSVTFLLPKTVFQRKITLPNKRFLLTSAQNELRNDTCYRCGGSQAIIFLDNFEGAIHQTGTLEVGMRQIAMCVKYSSSVNSKDKMLE